MDDYLDVPYNLRGNPKEAILDAMNEIESLRAERNVLGLTVGKQDQEIETLRAKNKQLAEEVAYLVDHYQNGIRYDEERNEYLVVWTQKQIDDAAQEAKELMEKLNWIPES